jgi:putative endonuclease
VWWDFGICGILPRTGRNPGLTAVAQARKLAGVSAGLKALRGAASEQLAAEYLQSRGLILLARNLRCRGGELDLVFLDGEVLAIVEVRQRVRADFGGALASVTPGKQRKIIRAARYFACRQVGWRTHPMRFDVIGLEGLPDGNHRLAWIKDAFRAT